MKKQILNDDVFIIDNFLSHDECDKLIAESEGIGFELAKVNIHGRQVVRTSIRNNQRVLHKDFDWAIRYWEMLKPFCLEPIGNSNAIGLNELFRFYKYSNEQEFKIHRDDSYIRNEREFSLQTFLIYLNDNFEGGKTSFSNIEVQPKKGRALIFTHSMVHEGQKVFSGHKYVLRTDIMYRLKDNI